MAEPTKTPVQQEAERKQQEEQKKQEEAKRHAEEQKRKAEHGQQSASPRAGAEKNKESQRGGGTVGGAMTTYGSPKAHMPDPEPVFLKRDEIKGLVGDILPGELAHIELDDHGNPTGAAFRDIPDPDSVTAAVYGTPQVLFDELVTPSGAPITKMMNPEPKLWDAGMSARNPIPEPTDRQREFRQIGGGVINQPVTV